MSRIIPAFRKRFNQALQSNKFLKGEKTNDAEIQEVCALASCK